MKNENSVWYSAALTFFLGLLMYARLPAASLELSVYCTAGDLQHYAGSSEARERMVSKLKHLQTSRIFLEGRRGGEYVPPAKLAELRDFFTARGIRCSGGIATVPGAGFGERQQGGLDWLNWESRKTQMGVAAFFAEDAPVFSELVVDDFFCTGDVSSQAEEKKGSRSWGQYRQDLLVSLISPLMVNPARAASPKTRLILKFPQWYDQFHLYGYDTARMPAYFDEGWVGTEVRDPATKRMGFVQPTEGYMNFSWISSQAGSKVRGAWFDHIECSAQNFIDQAYQSVLAGARELTLFHLGDVMEDHTGDGALAAQWPELLRLAGWVQAGARRGVAFYKPAGSDGSENVYLADYLGMIGLPVLPRADYPNDTPVVFLPVQAGADTNLIGKMNQHLEHGATLVLTPALVRRLGASAVQMTGFETGPGSVPASATSVKIDGASLKLEYPLDIDAGVKAADCEVLVSATAGEQQLPVLTRKKAQQGTVLVLNVRTFSENDFGKDGEWLLAPKKLGLSAIPPALNNRIRDVVLQPLGFTFHGPSGIGFVCKGKQWSVYNFLDEAAHLQIQGQAVELAPHQCLWR